MRRDHTDYLKGIVLVGILVAHYSNYYATGIFPIVQGYANSLVSIFFVLSGFAMFFSLEKLRRQDIEQRGIWARYFFDRAIRIYPLYWLVLLLMPFFFHEYGAVHQLNFSTLAVFAGLPWVKPPGLFWFVSAILQCYILAPAFYALLKRVKPVRYFVINLYLMAVFMLLSVLFLYLTRDAGTGSGLVSVIDALSYRRFLMANVFFFSLGMVIPSLIFEYQEKLQSRFIYFITAMLFLVSVYLDRHTDTLYRNSDLFIAFFMILCAFAVCLFTVSIEPSLPLRRIFSPVGTLSYPVYLLHMLYFAALASLGLIINDSVLSWICTILIFPAFYGLCLITTKFQNLADNRMRDAIFKITSPIGLNADGDEVPAVEKI